MRKEWVSSLACTALLGAMPLGARDFSIAEFGAVPGGERKSTAAFKAAFDAVEKAGGGRVIVPAGRWFTGAIHLRSNSELHLEKDAEILFSQDPNDYLPAVFTTWEGMECWNYSPLVYAYGCTNVAITGEGTLRAFEGSFKTSFWSAWSPQDKGAGELRRMLYDWGAKDCPVEKRRMTEVGKRCLRPHFIQFNRCRNVRLEGFRVRESPFWTIHLYLSDGVVARGLDVVAKGHNNDGIDIEMTRNVLVEKCKFDQGDDTFVIKSGRNRDAWRLATPTENVEIRDCHMARARSFFCCGSEISGGVRNIWFHDCSVEEAGRLCYIKTNRRRGAFVEGVRCENIHAKKCLKIFAIETDVLYEWAKFPDYELRTTRIGDISLRNVTSDEAMSRVDIQGDVTQPVRGIRLERVCAGKALAPDRFVNVTDVVDDGRPVRAVKEFRITDYGAKAGMADATEAIRGTIEAAAVAGGGRVSIPKGTWPVGPFDLRDGIELHMDVGATLRFSDDPSRYAKPDGSYRGLIAAEGAEGVRISGRGRIEALTDGWKRVPAAKRPPVCAFRNCQSVHLEAVSFRNAPGKVIEVAACRRVMVHGVEFIAQVGIGDFISVRDDAVSHVREEECSFRIGDGRLSVYDPSHRLVFPTFGAEVKGRAWDKLSDAEDKADDDKTKPLTADAIAKLGAGQIPLCMVGDSITWAQNGDFWRKWLLKEVPDLAFVGTHAARFGFSHAGEGGDSTVGVLRRVDNPARIPDCPYYHLMIGCNDSSAARRTEDVARVSAHTVSNVWKIVDRLLARKVTRKVFLASILPLRAPANPFRDVAGSAANALMRREVARRYPGGRVVWVEYERPLREKEDVWMSEKYLGGGIHPTPEGYRAIAHIFAPILRREAQPIGEADASEFGVAVENLWDATANRTRPLIPGWYVLSFDPGAAQGGMKVRLVAKGAKGGFDKTFDVTAAPGTRCAVPFMTGYQGYGYDESPFELAVSRAAGDAVRVDRVQVEKMRPSGLASRYVRDAAVDSDDPVYAGERIISKVRDLQ